MSSSSISLESTPTPALKLKTFPNDLGFDDKPDNNFNSKGLDDICLENVDDINNSYFMQNGTSNLDHEMQNENSVRKLPLIQDLNSSPCSFNTSMNNMKIVSSSTSSTSSKSSKSSIQKKKTLKTSNSHNALKSVNKKLCRKSMVNDKQMSRISSQLDSALQQLYSAYDEIGYLNEEKFEKEKDLYDQLSKTILKNVQLFNDQKNLLKNNCFILQQNIFKIIKILSKLGLNLKPRNFTDSINNPNENPNNNPKNNPNNNSNNDSNNNFDSTQNKNQLQSNSQSQDQAQPQTQTQYHNQSNTTTSSSTSSNNLLNTLKSPFQNEIISIDDILSDISEVNSILQIIPNYNSLKTFILNEISSPYLSTEKKLIFSLKLLSKEYFTRILSFLNKSLILHQSSHEIDYYLSSSNGSNFDSDTIQFIQKLPNLNECKNCIYELEKINIDNDDLILKISVNLLNSNNFNNLSDWIFEKIDNEIDLINSVKLEKIREINYLSNEILKYWEILYDFSSFSPQRDIRAKNISQKFKYNRIGEFNGELDKRIILCAKNPNNSFSMLGLNHSSIKYLKNILKKLIIEKSNAEIKLNDYLASCEKLWKQVFEDENYIKTFKSNYLYLNNSNDKSQFKLTTTTLKAFNEEQERLILKKKNLIKDLILNFRSKIIKIWDQLHYTKEERLEQFSLIDNTTEYNDKTLDLYEAQYEKLNKTLGYFKPILDLIQNLTKIIEDKKALEESQQNSSRLLKRNYSKILLEEEKMRRNINKNLPKVIYELKSRLIDYKNQNHQKDFLFDGINYLNKVLEIEDGLKIKSVVKSNFSKKNISTSINQLKPVISQPSSTRKVPNSSGRRPKNIAIFNSSTIKLSSIRNNKTRLVHSNKRNSNVKNASPLRNTVKNFSANISPIKVQNDSSKRNSKIQTIQTIQTIKASSPISTPRKALSVLQHNTYDCNKALFSSPDKLNKTPTSLKTIDIFVDKPKVTPTSQRFYSRSAENDNDNKENFEPDDIYFNNQISDSNSSSKSKSKDRRLSAIDMINESIIEDEQSFITWQNNKLDHLNKKTTSNSGDGNILCN
ncbi:Ase1p ASCRUDRAFT_87729 [Ascoidea rubescens DSM 1968]|uniref:Uncharacterized protein n=1 Tax=Ascoidea rubescens DSM 1968 TaxID=1344418 RepID=A0A1D2VCK4_9ASCO|nr:hypothetical protein ASCRUDRAFT_87729 [Ascoidea rubescens DSM 1968]ODV59292.1 hypothetical protein ASCRUDRAFT_87729 [Ascoidea rubescens DSM 1968]